MHTYIYSGIHIYINTHVYVCIYIHTYKHTFIQAYIIHAYKYTYIHTHTHTFIYIVAVSKSTVPGHVPKYKTCHEKLFRDKHKPSSLLCGTVNEVGEKMFYDMEANDLYVNRLS